MKSFRRAPAAPRPQKKSQLLIAGLTIALTRKRMKYIRLKVSPPEGAVTVSAPHSASNREIEAMVTERLDWIQQQQAYFRARPAAPVIQYEQDEQHPLWGENLKLALVTGKGRARIVKTDRSLTLINGQNKTREERAQLMGAFYRQQLDTALPALIQKWQCICGRKAGFWGIKKMKTRWGSCNTYKGRIWLNLELVKYPTGCLEYVIVHELVHLYEASHNQRFYKLLASFMPDWDHWEQHLKHIE